MRAAGCCVLYSRTPKPALPCNIVRHCAFCMCTGELWIIWTGIILHRVPCVHVLYMLVRICATSVHNSHSIQLNKEAAVANTRDFELAYHKMTYILYDSSQLTAASSRQFGFAKRMIVYTICYALNGTHSRTHTRRLCRRQYS